MKALRSDHLSKNTHSPTDGIVQNILRDKRAVMLRHAIAFLSILDVLQQVDFDAE